MSVAAQHLPAEVRPYRIHWPYAVAIPLVHLLALLALLPWLFSWTGVALVVVGHHVFGLLGMTLGYHRLMAHRSFASSKRFEHFLGLLGACSLQDSPMHWVAMHNKHHQDADERPDPHSPRVNLLWAHVGWLMVENRAFRDARFHQRYAPELWRDPFHRWLARDYNWFNVYLAHTVLLFVGGLAAGWGTTGDFHEGMRFGLSLLVWGAFVRTTIQWHLTWSVNSVTHRWGYRSYETPDDSRNNWLVALLTHGEGWHNNHHAEPRRAAHGHRWWELDLTYAAIRLLAALGLVTNLTHRPSRDMRRGTSPRPTTTAGRPS